MCRRQESIVWARAPCVPAWGMKENHSTRKTAALMGIGQFPFPEELCFGPVCMGFMVLKFSSLKNFFFGWIPFSCALSLIYCQPAALNENPKLTQPKGGCMEERTTWSLFPSMTQILNWNDIKSINLRNRKVNEFASFWKYVSFKVKFKRVNWVTRWLKWLQFKHLDLSLIIASYRSSCNL
jgi:hypothetical protein